MAAGRPRRSCHARRRQDAKREGLSGCWWRPTSPVTSDGRRSSAAPLHWVAQSIADFANAVAASVALHRAVPCFANAAGGLGRRDRARTADAGHRDKSGHGRLPGARRRRNGLLLRRPDDCRVGRHRARGSGRARRGSQGHCAVRRVIGAFGAAAHAVLRGAPTVVSGGNGAGRRCAGPTAASRRGGIGAERRTTSVASRPRHPRFWPSHGSVRLQKPHFDA